MPDDFSEPIVEGFEIFNFAGQRRFRCPCCRYDAKDLDTIRRHVRGLHGHHPLAAKEKKEDRPAMVVNAEGKEEAAPVQMEHGFEIFTVQGQKRYRCPEKWESGARCKFDTYDLEYMRKHASSPHTRDGKPRQNRQRMETSPILDAEGKPITREYREPKLPEDFEYVPFKR